MSHKRKASVVASLVPENDSLNASTSGEDSRLRKRVRFHVLPQTQQMFVDFSNPPVAIIGTNQIFSPRSRRDRLMSEQNDEQWRESGGSDEWSGIEDREERRRIQNRISQRKFSECTPLRELSPSL